MPAAASWDGRLCAFTDGDDAAVVLATAWDSRSDADAFEQAAREWLAADDAPVIVGRPSATRVTLAIATTDGRGARHAGRCRRRLKALASGGIETGEWHVGDLEVEELEVDNVARVPPTQEAPTATRTRWLSATCSATSVSQ